MEKNYEKITALVPQGEHFDATAINEGVYLTESHVANIEVALKNADTLAAQMQQQLDAEKQTATDLQGQLDAANNTVSTKDETIAALQNEVAALKAKPAADFAEGGKEEDDHGGGEVKQISEITKEANEKRAAKGLPLIK